MSVDWNYTPKRHAEMVERVAIGDHVYCEPCKLTPADRGWYDARSGSAPGFCSLRARLRELRGIRLAPAGPYYWLAVATRAAHDAPHARDAKPANMSPEQRETRVERKP